MAGVHALDPRQTAPLPLVYFGGRLLLVRFTYLRCFIQRCSVLHQNRFRRNFLVYGSIQPSGSGNRPSGIVDSL